MRIERASHRHPGFDSGIDLCRTSGDVVMGHLVHDNGADRFGGPPLVIATELQDGSVVTLYRFEWRWSPATCQRVLAWWYGPGEWDCVTPERYGPTLECSGCPHGGTEHCAVPF